MKKVKPLNHMSTLCKHVFDTQEILMTNPPFHKTGKIGDSLINWFLLLSWESKRFNCISILFHFKQATFYGQHVYFFCGQVCNMWLRFAIQKSKYTPKFGIGVTITRDNQSMIRGWTLQERSSGHQVLDELIAIKLLMSKAAVQKMEKIEVQIQNKVTFTLLQQRKSQEMRMLTLMEDIYSLKSLFRMCSFCLINRNLNHITHRISVQALDFVVDQEFWIPQC